jgi:hypothetical protein
MKRTQFAIWAFLGIILLSGCELLNPKSKKTEFTIAIHEIVKYPRASHIEKEIPTITGQNIWISTTPYLFSNSIEKIECVPNKEDINFSDLKLKLNRRGSLIWMQLSVERSHRDLAFVVDGVFYRKVVPETITTEKDEFVLLNVKLDNTTANAIAAASEDNYYFFNPDEKKSPF